MFEIRCFEERGFATGWDLADRFKNNRARIVSRRINMLIINYVQLNCILTRARFQSDSRMSQCTFPVLTNSLRNSRFMRIIDSIIAESLERSCNVTHSSKIIRAFKNRVGGRENKFHLHKFVEFMPLVIFVTIFLEKFEFLFANSLLITIDDRPVKIHALMLDNSHARNVTFQY